MHIVQLLYKKYQKQAHYLSGCEQMNEPIFCDYVREKLNGLERIVIEENDNIGVLYYEQWKEEGKIFCSVPVYGYYADNEKMMYRLFMEICGLSTELQILTQEDFGISTLLHINMNWLEK